MAEVEIFARETYAQNEIKTDLFRMFRGQYLYFDDLPDDYEHSF
jgi:hypothetical protein